VEIPVAYGGANGPDLDAVAELTGHTPDEVVAMHSGAEYLVYFLGFSPGFPYLGGLPESIAAPRLETPRRRVPAGSVAIGGQQTGVYPIASPGGWRIIGRTPLRLFDPGADPPVLLRMGDHVRFVAKGSI
jgi:KipI family sensor histidine kinase inhibitor